MGKFMRDIFWRVSMALLLTLAAAGLFLYLYLFSPVLHHELYAWISAAFIGLAAGLSARFLLDAQNVFLRICAALSVMAVVLLAFTAALDLSPPAGRIDLENIDLGVFVMQPLPGLVIGAVFVLLSSWSWRLGGSGKSTRVKTSGAASKTGTKLKKNAPKVKRTKVKPKKVSTPARRSKRSGSAAKPKVKTSASASHLGGSGRRRPRVKRARPRASLWKTRIAAVRSSARQILSGNALHGSRTVQSPSTPPSRSLQVRPNTHKNLARRKRIKGVNVNLSGVVEHRCPYCLEEVLVGDPRGVRICPECGTRHHRDCWNVTGTCQVPHE